jgi:hypothetical protein
VQCAAFNSLKDVLMMLTILWVSKHTPMTKVRSRQVRKGLR